MSRIDDETLHACQDELEKISLSLSGIVSNPAVRKALGHAGALGGHGAAIGAGLGALHGIYKGYTDSRDQGGDVAPSVVHGLLGGLTGAGSGAIRGGLAGAAVGGVAGHLKPELMGELSKKLTTDKHWTGALGRFGQRQMHGFTGWAPEGGLKAIRGGSWAAEQALGEAKKKGLNTENAEAALKSMQKLENRGLTNIPGVLKAMAGKDRVEALKELAGAQWHGQTGKAKLLTLGLGAGLPLYDAATAKDVEGGPGKGEQIGAGVGGAVGGLVSSALPFSAQSPVMDVTRSAGGHVGKAIDWIRGRRPGRLQYANNPEDPSMAGQNTPSERHMSNSALGQAPEGMMV